MIQNKPYVFGSSHAIKNPVIKRKGIVNAESGPTSDRSPYFTAFKAVTVEIALNKEEAMSIKKYDRETEEKGINKMRGNTIKAHISLHQYASVYSSRDCFLSGLVSIFQRSSDHAFKNDTINAKIIPYIFY